MIHYCCLICQKKKINEIFKNDSKASYDNLIDFIETYMTVNEPALSLYIIKVKYKQASSTAGFKGLLILAILPFSTPEFVLRKVSKNNS